MKNLKYSIQAIVGVTLLISACSEDFLNRYPKANPSPDNFFVNEDNARYAVNACYEPWQWGSSNMLQRDMLILLDAMTDDSYWRTNRSSSIQLEQWDISPTHGTVSAWWQYPFQCINAANFALDNIPLSTDPGFTADLQAPYLAEARFFRAYSYLFLTTFYGGVPLLTSAASNFDEFNTPRSSKSEVMAQIIADFTYAKENLPESQAIAGPPTSAAAAGFLAKTYLFMEDWANAETAARDAIQLAENSGYALQDDYMSIWSEEGNPELLFYWSFEKNSEDYGQNMTVQRLCRDLPGTLRSAVNGDGWGYSIPQRDLFDAFENDDPRREFTLYYPGHNYEVYPGPDDYDYTHETITAPGDTLRWDVTYKAGDTLEYDYRWSQTGLNVRKMTRPLKDIADVRWSGVDIPVMRLAEVYLILAEALAEQGNAEALTWVNKVRSRPSVNVAARTLSDGRPGDGSLVDIVRHERRVELAMEGLRLFDLIRWGTLAEVFGDGKKVKRHWYSDFMDESASLLKYDAPVGNLTLDPIFPIPQSEIDHNSQINENNPGW